jgi:hypothetical protein
VTSARIVAPREGALALFQAQHRAAFRKHNPLRCRLNGQLARSGDSVSRLSAPSTSIFQIAQTLFSDSPAPASSMLARPKRIAS